MPHRIGFALATVGWLLLAAASSSGQNPSTGFADVKVLIQQGQLNAAKALLSEKLKAQPASVESYNLLGIIESSNKNLPEAEKAFQRALKLEPTSKTTHNNLGNLYVSENRPDLAEREFREVIRIEPNNAGANYNLGLLLMARGLAAEAIAHLQRVKPVNIATQLNLIRAYFGNKNRAEGLRRAAEVSSQNLNDLQVQFSLGLILASEKQYRQAQVHLEQAVTLAPDSFEVLYNLGLTMLRNGEYAKAELIVVRALKIQPESPETLYLLGEVKAAASRPLDALDVLVRAHRLAPQNTDIIYLMAQISISQNYFEDAIPLLESGVELAPRRPDLLAALGASYFMAGNVDKAITVFNKLIGIEPSPRSYAFLGLSYRHLGRFDEAKSYFAKGLKLDPHNAACLFNLGFMAERQGNVVDAEAKFAEVLRTSPDYPDALLELANLRMTSKRPKEAEELLRRFVKNSHDPATGYYKLAMVERSLHENEAADRDLSVFQTLSKDVAAGPYPFEHLFDYLDSRSQLPPGEKAQLDLNELTGQIKKHPDQPEDLYLLAETYLKLGRVVEARASVADLDKISSGDYRTMTGVGVLLARYHLYDDAIDHFERAIQANPEDDEAKFDAMNAFFRKGDFPKALAISKHISAQGQQDEAYLALLGDIYGHSGDLTVAKKIFRDAMQRNPDNDQDYLSLALLQFRDKDVLGAKETLAKGYSRIPGSGKLIWGQGLAAMMDGRSDEAEQRFERAVEMMPEWPGSYSTLGVFYFQTGQIRKAREVLSRFKSSGVRVALDVDRIEKLLSVSPQENVQPVALLSMASREQILQLALTLADKTL